MLLSIFIWITSLFRSIISWPFRIVMIALSVANFKVIYKSGHVEYLFMRKINISFYNGSMSSIEWEALSGKVPLHIGVDDVAAIYKLY